MALILIKVPSDCGIYGVLIVNPKFKYLHLCCTYPSNDKILNLHQDYNLSIDAHWNDWDNWIVDSVNFEDDVPEDFDQDAAIAEIEEEFLNNMM